MPRPWRIRQRRPNVRIAPQRFFKILDRDKTEVRYNSEWLDKLSYYDMVKLAAKYTLVLPDPVTPYSSIGLNPPCVIAAAMLFFRIPTSVRATAL